MSSPYNSVWECGGNLTHPAEIRRISCKGVLFRTLFDEESQWDDQGEWKTHRFAIDREAFSSRIPLYPPGETTRPHCQAGRYREYSQETGFTKTKPFYSTGIVFDKPVFILDLFSPPVPNGSERLREKTPERSREDLNRSILRLFPGSWAREGVAIPWKGSIRPVGPGRNEAFLSMARRQADFLARRPGNPEARKIEANGPGGAPPRRP